MQQPARAVFEHYEDVEQPKRRRDRDEEVAGDNRLGADPYAGAAGHAGMYFLTVRGETRSPSLNSISLAIRCSPQSEFSIAMRRISSARVAQRAPAHIDRILAEHSGGARAAICCAPICAGGIPTNCGSSISNLNP
jgi:hypothetical protein